MRIYDIIIKKRNRLAHTYQEIEYLIEGYTRGTIPDYQVSAWLMACFLNGLNKEETFYLTKSMLLSGKTIDLGFINKPKIDKHSTGGVGDKISLILAPAVASCGVVVPMTSGRGLGFSGGTLDKLESIPGFNVNLTEKEFKEVLKKVGYAMTGQTKDLAPADKKLYELRDVTGTVESIPFITSSILSKKLAEGADSIVMDVKFGSGAFMKTKDKAKSLAHSLVATAKKLERKVICILTSMDQPLGRAVGNSLEVLESINCMRGNGEKDIVELTEILGAYMLLTGDIVQSIEEGRLRIREKLQNGQAYEKFKESVIAQGGDINSVMDTEKLPHARYSKAILSQKSGYINRINTEYIGTASIFTGAGRFKKEDSIDPSSGIFINKKIGDYVRKGERLAILYYNSEEHLEEASELIKQSYIIENEKRGEFQLVHEVIQ